MKVRDYILAALLVVVLCVGVYVLVPAYVQHRKHRSTIEQLQENLAAKERELAALRRELEALRTDYRAIERVAREKFRWSLEGEKIYHFPPARPGGTPEPPEGTGDP